MVKVSITLPNNAQITFESEEPEVIHQIVEMALRELPRDLMLSAMPGDGGVPSQPPQPDGTPVVPARQADAPRPSRTKGPRPAATHPPPHQSPDTTSAGPAAQRAFIEFCQSANPTGDMRRVVVAAEGASRFLDLDRVGSEELGWLFDLAGWRRPHSVVQTLRNAARSKFRWLERIPGRSGHYSVTDLGRTIAPAAN